MSVLASVKRNSTEDNSTADVMLPDFSYYLEEDAVLCKTTIC